VRIGGRRLGAAGAGFLLVVVVALAVLAGLRWRAAGVARVIAAPPGAVIPSFDDPGDERDVGDRADIVARRLRNDRGKATVRVYALPPGSPWLQARKVVATQIDHWEQLGDCADDLRATIVECSWREPTRWWPREVALTMVRLAAASPGGPRPTFVVIGSAVGG
jgi:hypothetical protein